MFNDIGCGKDLPGSGRPSVSEETAELDTRQELEYLLRPYSTGMSRTTVSGNFSRTYEGEGLPLHAEIVEVEIYFTAIQPVWCSRPTTGVPLAHATMNFGGLDLTTSDRWHQKTTQQQLYF
ncbi:hypothetical protein TNCV_1081321 [Trichonephila clavipes]|nr:hypothetical protein TNCV_1081321 [Trichonephila clavipes]